MCEDMGNKEHYKKLQDVMSYKTMYQCNLHDVPNLCRGHFMIR